MIPVSLTIKGLYSYQAAQTIHFDRLLDGQLFGIFGSVGSGKSSILEAMTFALYGQSERLDRNDNRNYNMMNLKSDELLIDFIFRNFDDQEYRFSVRGKRHGKDFDKVNTFDRSAYRKTDGSWLPLESANAESVLGLSYDNFRRTVIIPQGKFQEFLQLGDKDRTTMLKEIFQLDKYEFYYQTTSLERKNNEAIQNFEGQLFYYTGLDQEGIEQKQKTLEELSEQLKALQLGLNSFEVRFREQEALKKLFEDLERQKQKLSELLQDEEQYAISYKKISGYEYCLANFKDGLKRKKELEADISTRSSLIAQSSGRLQKSNEELGTLEQRFDVVKEDYLKQDERMQLVADYRLLRSIKLVRLEIDKQTKRLTDGKPHLEAALAEKTKAESRIEELKDQLKAQKAALPDIARLSQVRAWHAERKAIERRIAELRLEQERLEQQLKELPEVLKPWLVPPLFSEGDQARPLPYYQEKVQQLREENIRKQEAVSSQIAHYHLQLKLGEFADQLKNGGPCLLCGSEHHPSVLTVSDVNEHLSAARKQEEEVRKYDKACEHLLQVLHGIRQNEQNLFRQVENLNAKLKNEEEALADHRTRHIWPDFDHTDESKVEEAFAAYENDKNKLDLLEKELERTEKSCRTASDSYEKYRKALEGIQSIITAKQAELTALSGQLKHLKYQDQEGLNEDELEAKAGELEQKLSSVKKEHEGLTTQIEVHKSEKITVLERINSNREILKRDEDLIAQIKQSLHECLEKSEFSDWDEIEGILNEELDLNQLKADLQNYQQQVHTCKQILQELELKAAGKSFDLKSFENLAEEVSLVRKQVQALNNEHVKAEADLIKQKSDLQKKILLEGQVDKLKKRAANLNTLKQLFKGSGFVNYVSSVYLHNLCEAANERFYKLTRQSLRLEVTEKNEFQVRDFMNNGKVRNVKTLSGGQTFQASLSLALALAESVQQQNKAKQNFFFLDEGFGSLDKDSLQVAFETLKSLRKENRKVGIISHVEDLQQEIEVYLKVSNDPMLGSSIKASWE